MQHLRLVDDAYDVGGAYWGAGARLYRIVDAENEIEFFVRGINRSAAKLAARKVLKGARFYV